MSTAPKISKLTARSSSFTYLDSRDNVAIQKHKRLLRDDRLHQWVNEVTETQVFVWVIIVTILLNALLILIEVLVSEDVTNDLRFAIAISVLNDLFLAVFTWEFILKVYAKPKGYWQNAFNLFDFIVLVVSFVQPLAELIQENDGTNDLRALQVFRALRTLRILRTVSMFRGLQVLVSALIDTIRNSVLNVVLLLLLVMFLFGIMGYYFFGYKEDNSDKERWGSLGRSMLTLFTYVTVDGWTTAQEILDKKGFTGSRIFTITFIFIGHFILTNVFVGVIIMNISEATEHHKAHQRKARELLVRRKKKYMMQRQHEEVQKMTKQMGESGRDFQKMYREFQNNLRDDDFTGMSEIYTNLLWINLLRKQLEHIDNTTYKIQQLQFEASNILAQLATIQAEKKRNIREEEGDEKTS